MDHSAHLTDHQAVGDFRAALSCFEDEAAAALESLGMELQRLVEWLQRDRPRYWKEQVRRAWDAVAQARAELERARMKEVAGQRPSCYEEKKALQAAKQRARLAEEKQESVRRWCRTVQHEISEFQAGIGPLERSLEQDVPRALAALARMVRALEGYVETTSPAASSAPRSTGKRAIGPASDGNPPDDPSTSPTDDAAPPR